MGSPNYEAAVAVARAKGEHYPVCNMPPREVMNADLETRRAWREANRGKCNCWKVQMEEALKTEPRHLLGQPPVEKVSLLVDPARGVVEINNVGVQVVTPALLDVVRSGREDPMYPQRQCAKFATELEELLDRWGIRRFARETLT
jgi:hypothetical protein